jgi:hypothetical protein
MEDVYLQDDDPWHSKAICTSHVAQC